MVTLNFVQTDCDKVSALSISEVLALFHCDALQNVQFKSSPYLIADIVDAMHYMAFGHIRILGDEKSLRAALEKVDKRSTWSYEFLKFDQQ